jgi:hypothetical protein
MQGPVAMVAMVRELAGKMPWWAVRRMQREDLAAMTMALQWMRPRHDCVDFPVASFEHAGMVYHLPTAKGQNICCLEYPLADEYYMRYAANTNDAEALALLLATIARPENPDRQSAVARGDARMALHSRAEIEARALVLLHAPHELHVAALMYFGGLKEYVHRIYGTWLFEVPFDEDDEDEQDEDDEATPQARTSSIDGPDFGWWGIFQHVAESGVFGNLKEVYQASLHDVCIFLVRQRIKARQEMAAMEAAKAKAKSR